MNEEKVKDLLREKGLKVTSQRLMVLNILSAHGDELLTVEEIYDLAKEESPEIGLATIYRTVQVLLELHVIEKVTFDDGFARYELNGQETDDFPFPAVLPDAKPVMTAMPGWKCDISGVRTWEDLPQAARDYVEYVEREIGCRITYVSVGPERDSIIVR